MTNTNKKNIAITRIYSPNIYQIKKIIDLDLESSHKLLNVLRCKIGENIILFDGNNHQAMAEIISFTKKNITVKISSTEQKNLESPLNIHLYQAIAKSDKMDFIIQKATELGVASITPIITERTIVKIKAGKIDSKLEHWQKVAIHATEQCGRNFISKINNPVNFKDFIISQEVVSATSKKSDGDNDNLELDNAKNSIDVNSKYDSIIVLDPKSKTKIKELSIKEKVAIFIGPEGGFADSEVDLIASLSNINKVNLGPRILRTETAAITAISALQLYFGDLS